MFRAIDAAKPGFSLQAAGQSVLWFQSTVLLTALGFFMWPHAFSAILTSKREQTFRRNAALLRSYQLILLFASSAASPRSRRSPACRRAGRPGAAAPVDPVVRPVFVGVIGAAG